MAITETLKTLIAFKSVSGNHEEARRQFAWIKQELKGLPLHIREYTSNDFQSMVITTQPDTKSPKVWLAAHLDVADGSPDVWEPKQEDGKIKGRGAHDMKFAAACYIELLKELGEKARNYDIGVMFTTDEEIGGANGAKILLEREGYRGGPVLLPDGGNVWKIENKAKGIWRFDVTGTGTSSHSSRPWESESALEPLVRFLAELCAFGDTFKTGDEKHWHLTYSVTMMNGGMFQNLVAASAQAVIDTRFTSDDELDRFRNGIEALLQKYPSLSVQTISLAGRFAVDAEHPAIQLFRSIAKEKTGIECGWNDNHGGSDARYFMPYNIPVILLWPKAGGYHTEDEWIDIADFHRFYDVMKAWTLELSESNAPTPLKKHTHASTSTDLVPSPFRIVGTVLVETVKVAVSIPKKALAYVRILK